MGKYSVEALDAYNDIKEDGGAVRVYNSSADTAPSDPSKPWLGSGSEDAGHDTYALFVISENDTTGINFSQLIYLPGYGINFDVTSECTIKDVKDKIWSIDEIAPLSVSGEEVILYIGKVSLWQAN